MTGEEKFFVGWQARIDPVLGRFLAAAAGVVLGLFVALGAALGGLSDDPADARFGLVPGQPPPLFPEQQTVLGTLVAEPYPLLYRAPDARHPRGTSILLSGEGKVGAPLGMAALDGRLVLAEGLLVARGSIAMLATGHAPLPQAGEAVLPPPAEKLGTWRLTGEICDGKCAAGLMRPGTGIAHRACASLCIEGQVPPVFVATGPVAGHAFLLLADPRGQAMDPALADWIGVRMQLEGAVERRGDLLVFLADPASARLP